jgi:hypothetical protein
LRARLAARGAAWEEDGWITVRCGDKEKRHKLFGEDQRRAAERVLKALVTGK